MTFFPPLSKYLQPVTGHKVFYGLCLWCQKRFDFEDLQALGLADEHPPDKNPCDCGGYEAASDEDRAGRMG